MKYIYILALLSLTSLTAKADSFRLPDTTFTGTDLSGTYICKGYDLHDTAFESTLTIQLDKGQSHDVYGSYIHYAEAGAYGTYKGTAATQKDMISFSFNNQDSSKKDYGTAIGTISKNKDNKLQFTLFYYEPEYKGGSRGLETCIQK